MIKYAGTLAKLDFVITNHTSKKIIEVSAQDELVYVKEHDITVSHQTMIAEATSEILGI